jgi:hypothetical protein
VLAGRFFILVFPVQPARLSPLLFHPVQRTLPCCGPDIPATVAAGSAQVTVIVTSLLVWGLPRPLSPASVRSVLADFLSFGYILPAGKFASLSCDSVAPLPPGSAVPLSGFRFHL